MTITDGEDISVTNNTIFHSGNIITAHGTPSKRFIFRDNIVSHNNYGFAGDNGVGKQVLEKYFPSGIFMGNVIINGKDIPKESVVVPARNYFASNFQAIGFIDLQKNDYRLAPNSGFRGKGTNGKDAGVDFATFEKAFGRKPF